MAKTVLILGGSGKIGRHSAQAFRNSGWTVKLYDRKTDDMRKAAKGVDVIINGLNPAGYKNWSTEIPRITREVIEAAKVNNATIVVPGNVYVFGNQPGVWDENTSHLAQTRKGKIRIEMEEAYKQAAEEHGVQTIILRAGDFIDDKPSDTLMSLAILPRVEKGVVQALGDPNVRHAFCYLPDWARACVALVEKRDRLNKFEDIPFPGSNFSIKQLAETISEATAKSIKIKKFPWIVIYLLSPFWRTAYEMIEMRYLNEIDHVLSDRKFKEVLPDFQHANVKKVMLSELPSNLRKTFASEIIVT